MLRDAWLWAKPGSAEKGEVKWEEAVRQDRRIELKWICNMTARAS